LIVVVVVVISHYFGGVCVWRFATPLVECSYLISSAKEEDECMITVLISLPSSSDRHSLLLSHITCLFFSLTHSRCFLFDFISLVHLYYTDISPSTDWLPLDEFIFFNYQSLVPTKRIPHSLFSRWSSRDEIMNVHQSNLHIIYNNTRQSEEEVVDHLPALKASCAKHCPAEKKAYNACIDRINKLGEGDCEAWYFDMLHCVDHCVAPQAFKKLK
jgi:ubiquinol-cytochrome c reductase subunit 6